jgi:2,5-diamino-6-(ribosylamino)-4(3H)-pyrimidinone 5'-phosphate reductase
MSPRSKVQSSKSKRRPFVFLNVATTADGKLAPPNRHFVPFSSKRDQSLLLELRTRADAVMAGARTVDSTEVTLGPGEKKYRELRLKNGLPEYNLRVIVSGSASVNPHAEIFRHKFSPIIILTTERARPSRVRALQKLGAIVQGFGRSEVDFSAALQWLRSEWKVKRLLCEGGGEINDALLRVGLVDEIYLTLCPKIFGGRSAPTLADGAGIRNLADATRLKMKSRRRVGDEMFLTYSVVNRSESRP